MVSPEQLIKPPSLKKTWLRPIKFSSIMFPRTPWSRDAWKGLRQVVEQMIMRRLSKLESKPILIKLCQLLTFTRNSAKLFKSMPREALPKFMLRPKRPYFHKLSASLALLVPEETLSLTFLHREPTWECWTSTTLSKKTAFKTRMTIPSCPPWLHPCLRKDFQELLLKTSLRTSIRLNTWLEMERPQQMSFLSSAPKTNAKKGWSSLDKATQNIWALPIFLLLLRSTMIVSRHFCHSSVRILNSRRLVMTRISIKPSKLLWHTSNPWLSTSDLVPRQMTSNRRSSTTSRMTMVSSILM